MRSNELTTASCKTDALKLIQLPAVAILSEVPCPDQGQTVLVPDWTREDWQPTNESSWKQTLPQAKEVARKSGNTRQEYDMTTSTKHQFKNKP